MSVLFEHHPHTANLVRNVTIPTVPGVHNHRETGEFEEEDSGRMTRKVGKRGMGWR